MKDWINWKIVVFLQASGTHWAIFLGVSGYLLINMLGAHQIENLTLSGNMHSLESVVKIRLYQHYDKVAWGCLFAFLGLAVKMFRKAERKLHRIY